MVREPWLITIDLDGTTLTSHDDGEVSFTVPEYNKEVLQEAVAKGHKIAVVTGRPWRDTKEIYKELGLSTVVGNYNGAHIHKPGDEGFVQSKTTLNRHILEEINQKLFDKYFDNFIIEDDNETLVYDLTDKDMLIKFHVEEGVNLRQLNTDEELFIDPYSAVYGLRGDVDRDDVMAVLKRKYGHALNMRFWELDGIYYIELNLKAIHKAAAMEKIAAYYNIPMHRTLAFGDGSNDIEMLEKAAIGVAMKNASGLVKAYANDVTKHTNDEAGVGHYIKNFLEESK